MLEIEMPAMAEYDVVCHTDVELCGNAEHVIRVMATAEDPRVTCGVCNQAITDIKPV